MNDLMPEAYLKAPFHLAQAFKDKLGPPKQLRIGLAWRGNAQHQYDYRRSCRLKDWVEFLPSGVEYHSLQVDPTQEESDVMSSHGHICNWSGELENFSQTAGLISNLDLVLSVDTSVAHLSGSMGQETWLLIPQSSDWRWFHGRSDSPWYNKMRLFRPQSDQKDDNSGSNSWMNVFAQINTALNERVHMSKQEV
jgi:hypothetical protein